MDGRQSTASQGISYWSLVWTQLRKDRIAVFGLWCILGLALLAIFAPLLSFNVPLYLRIGDHVEFPFGRELFNRLFFENSVDIFFNLLMALSPGYVLLYVLIRRTLLRNAPGVRVDLILILLLAHLLVFALVAPKSYFGVSNSFYRTSAVVDYALRMDQARAAGEKMAAVFPLRRHNYSQTDPVQSMKPPSRAHWFGTDKEGRDVFTRMLYGTRISLTIGVVAVAILVVIGVAVGATAGYFGGWIDLCISRFIEMMICVPVFILILTLAAFVEQRSIFHVMAIIGVTSWTGVARLVRAEFLRQKSLDYAQAALALGIPRWRIIFRHILPNAMGPVLVSATFGVASAILIESGLSFLGLGDISAPSWGQILSAGNVERKLWLILCPGFAIFFVVSVFNLVGEGLRDALDPKLRR
ncbi:MAG: ABC transporter permease [Candidatus Sumerlaeota bacterium]|nr:ABC transporter permease [Candidatus Sumerlaeota bacterium]